MNTQKSYEYLKILLQNHHQSHLLAFWEQLSPELRKNLFSQIQRLDFEKIDVWLEKFVKNYIPDAVKGDFVPAMSYNPTPDSPEQQRKYIEAVKLGKELISSGKVGGFVVAGGQGTRLGFDGPKGNFPISPVQNKTLFRIFADSIAAASTKYQTECPWYVMTSPLNYQETMGIFHSNDYYGLGENNVFIFQQGTLPNFGLDGRLLLADKSTIACSPDGHGGSLKALYESGALDDMKRRGIEYLSYWQVDNPLINIFDPLFIGLHVLDKAEMSSKALVKTGPKEKVGNFCMIDGRVNVIEYSDLRDELAEKRNPDSSLVFELGSIAIHIINRAFVEKLNVGGFSLPLHRAVKKIQHLDENGNVIESDGIKLESFIFDALPLASKSVILQTIRSEEFAPTKNATGIDSAESTRQMMVDRAAAWLESAGITIPRKPDGSPDCILEIDPRFALEKEDVKDKLDRITKITPKAKIYIS